MAVSILVDAPAFWQALAADIRAARHYVYLQAMTFEADAVGKDLAQALIACPAADRRVLIDSFSKYIVSDHFVYKPANWFNRAVQQERLDTLGLEQDFQRHGIQCRFTNPPGFLLHRFPARNHKKLIVIDDRIAYIGGINFSEHNFAWHDLMVRLDTPEIATFFKEEFLFTWNGQNQHIKKTVGEFDILICDGQNNAPIFEPVMTALATARKEIFVQSCYLMFPFFDCLRTAVSRGVHVTLLTSSVNNWRHLRDYIPWEAQRAGIELRFYPNRMTHLKAILIDGEQLIFGSSNFEFLSYLLYQEIMVMTRQTELIEAFKNQVMLPDLAQSLPVRLAVRPGIGRLRYLQLKLLSKIVPWLSRI